MEKLLENLKEAIKHYEDCVNINSDKYLMPETIILLSKCCREIDKECEVIFETMFN